MPALNSTEEVLQAFSTCKEYVRYCAEKAGRNPDDIRLLVVAKSRPAYLIRALYTVGQSNFGENYLQEAVKKIEELQDLPLTWHFIGRIQRNKTALIAQHFAWVESIDSALIATRLNAARAKYQKPLLNVCVQINIDNDPLKSGIAVTETETLLRHILTLSHLRLRGLMILPKATSTFTDPLTTFQTAKKLLDDFNQRGFGLDTLSMGMSEDMEDAIRAGSTLLRIGRRIFS